MRNLSMCYPSWPTMGERVAAIVLHNFLFSDSVDFKESERMIV